MIEKTILAADGQQIQTFVWPNERAKGWVHILHGMDEHALRYDQFAQQLVAAGYAVVAHNHRGHGTGENVVLGVYAENVGWQDLVQDVDIVRGDICAEELPYFIFAHSMGTFVGQSYLVEQPNSVAGLVLSGSNFQAVGLSKVARFIVKIERFRLGRDKISRLVQFLSFGSFNGKFKPNRTEFDWLSRDDAEVDKYIADPLCGFGCSTGFWYDLLGGLIDLYAPSSFKKIQTDLPILIFGGTLDPVGQSGKGLPRLVKAYEDCGQKNVTLKLYENGRHEMLNETNKQQVHEDVIGWIEMQNG